MIDNCHLSFAQAMDSCDSCDVSFHASLLKPVTAKAKVVLVLQSTNFDLEFVYINCQSLAASVREEALGWVQALSQCMRELDTQALEVTLQLC